VKKPGEPTMRLFLLPLLILPLSALAAEPLEGKSLEDTYIPISPNCLASEKDRKSSSCPPEAVTKAVSDAEEQATGLDPATRMNSSEPLPPSRQLPADELSPQQRLIMEQIRSLPGQIQH
jgi:hypothetical protein